MSPKHLGLAILLWIMEYSGYVMVLAVFLILDAVVLSNIIDNLYPEDAEKLLEEVYRILKYHGKVLVKVNSFLSKEKIEQWNIKPIKDNLLDDGMILWNNTTEQWQAFFHNKFSIVRYEDIYYEEYEQYNRMFCLIKKS